MRMLFLLENELFWTKQQRTELNRVVLNCTEFHRVALSCTELNRIAQELHKLHIVSRWAAGFQVAQLRWPSISPLLILLILFF